MKAVLIFICLLFQQQETPPEEGKPASCNNFHGTPEAHRCKCGRAMHEDCDKPEPDVEMDGKCQTYCRKQNCKCVSGCVTD